ncbi:MAG TPA: efflux RND transporter periplasmic adaptor subunit, partial [Devosiaceae bacterium]
LARDRAKALGASISAQARDSAQFAYDKAEAQVTQLAAAHDQAVRQLAQYRVTAPIAGIVLAVDADAGQVVSTSNTLFSIGDMSPPLVETDVDEIYGSRIMVGQSARVAPVGSDAPIAATVSFVAPSVDTTTGGRTVRLSFDAAPAESLPSGQTMSVNIEVSHFDKGISVPRSALLDLSGAPYVYLDVGGKAEKQSVSVRAWPADRLIVTKGLTQGDALITNPHGLEPGMLVAVAPAP